MINALVYLKLVWFRLFEAAVIAGGFSASIILGVAVGWMSDNRPVYVENPEPGSHYVENPRLKAGEFVITVRSLKRLETCAVDAGVWIVTRSGDLLYPIDTTRAVARPNVDFRKGRTAYRVPWGIPAGLYSIRSYPVCDRNPLSQVQQQLQDLPFEVIE